MTKKFFLTTLTAVALFLNASAQNTWTIDHAHSSITFNVTHLAISDVEGKFKTFDGTVVAAKPDFTDAKINFTVDVASVSTDNDMRDGHLKTDDFFSADKYPKMTFESTSFTKVDDKNYNLEGNLTMRGVTKKVKFAVKYGGTIKDYRGTMKAGFSAKTTINRNDFGITGGKAGGTVSDDVDITVRLELAEQAPAAK